MGVTCCENRLNVNALFEADQGEFFIHRNIANLVLSYESDGLYYGTSAAMECAVIVLKVAHLIVLGHADCGEMRECLDM